MLDVNVLIGALLCRDGAPARLLLRWLAGDFELVVSDHLLAELRRSLAYAKLRSRIPEADALAFVDLIEATATKAVDPENPGRRSRDPGDDYVLELAASTAAAVVSGDRDLLDLGANLPIYSPADFHSQLDRD